MGTVGILNVGAGDTKLTFDKNDPAECIRAARIVRDMLRRGYALLVEVRKGDDGRPIYQRATDFDENTCEYIIADFDSAVAAKSDKVDGHEENVEASATPPSPPPRKSKSRRIGAEKTSAVAISRSAGG